MIRYFCDRVLREKLCTARGLIGALFNSSILLLLFWLKLSIDSQAVTIKVTGGELALSLNGLCRPLHRRVIECI